MGFPAGPGVGNLGLLDRAGAHGNAHASAVRVLVTGSSGHLGEALVRVLASEGFDVVGVDILASPTTDVVGSIVDRVLVRSCVEGVTPSCTPRRCTSPMSPLTPGRSSWTRT